MVIALRNGFERERLQPRRQGPRNTRALARQRLAFLQNRREESVARMNSGQCAQIRAQIILLRHQRTLQDALKQFLIDSAMQEWQYSLGQTYYPWRWYLRGGVYAAADGGPTRVAATKRPNGLSAGPPDQTRPFQ